MSDKNMALTELKMVNGEYFIEIPDYCDFKEGDSVEIIIKDQSLIIGKIKTDYSKLCKKLPSDYEFYGGEIIREEFEELAYNDCSTCKFFNVMKDDSDFGVCTKTNCARVGLLTFKHQSGFQCNEK